MTKAAIDWMEVQGVYLAGEKPRRIAQMYGIDAKQLRNVITRQGWCKQREEIRLKVAEEFVAAQRDMNTRAMNVVNNVLAALVNDDGSMNWEACRRVPAYLVRLALNMAMPDKIRIKEYTETYDFGDLPEDPPEALPVQQTPAPMPTEQAPPPKTASAATKPNTPAETKPVTPNNAPAITPPSPPVPASRYTREEAMQRLMTNLANNQTSVLVNGEYLDALMPQNSSTSKPAGAPVSQNESK